MRVRKQLPQVVVIAAVPVVDDGRWRGSTKQHPMKFQLGHNELTFLLNVLTPESFDKLAEKFYEECKKDAEQCIR